MGPFDNEVNASESLDRRQKGGAKLSDFFRFKGIQTSRKSPYNATTNTTTPRSCM